MDDLDKKIRQQLRSEQNTFVDQIKMKPGLFADLAAVYTGQYRIWVIMSTLVATILGGMMLWTGFRFYTASSVEEQLTFGVSLLLVVVMQGIIKLWVFSQTNRQALLLEIKRLELKIEQLEKDE